MERSIHEIIKPLKISNKSKKILEKTTKINLTPDLTIDIVGNNYSFLEKQIKNKKQFIIQNAKKIIINIEENSLPNSQLIDQYKNCLKNILKSEDEEENENDLLCIPSTPDASECSDTELMNKDFKYFKSYTYTFD